jgi:hypothetical protein
MDGLYLLRSDKSRMSLLDRGTQTRRGNLKVSDGGEIAPADGSTLCLVVRRRLAIPYLPGAWRPWSVSL